MSTVDCAFCEIAGHERAAQVVHEDDATIAFMDMRQPRAGHVLVIPTTHVENVYGMDARIGGAVMRTTAAVARAVRDAFAPDGLSLWQSNGPGARQEVPHFHMHVMPRWIDDSLLRIYPHRVPELGLDELSGQADAVRRQLALQ